MNKIFTFIFIFLFTLSFSNTSNAQTTYATIASGLWSDVATWETFSTYAAAIAATPGSGTVATTAPSGTHNVLIRSGNTVSMNLANRGCKSIIIQTGGKLWANETTARRLQIGSGGTGFAYPLVDTVQIDGTLGGPSDGVFMESGTQAQLIKVSGTGSIDILRIRMPGGAAGALTLSIDANINLWQAANYALTAVYNPAASDDYTVNILSGRTVAIKTVDGYFHNSQNSATYGKYTYNIFGTLDISANTQLLNQLATNITAPAGTASRITVNVDGGTFKTGAAIKCDTSTTGTALVSTGISDFNVINNGVLDASVATYVRVGKTSDGAGGYYDMMFGTDATGTVKMNVGTTDVKFPIGLSTATTRNYCRIANSGTADIHTVGVKSTFDHVPADITKVVNRQWTISEATTGGSFDTIRLGWVTADQAAAFDPAGAVFVMGWSGSAWVYYPVNMSGSGTIDDPYQARAYGITSLSVFGITSFAPVPLRLLSFTGSLKNEKLNLNWSVTAQENVNVFSIEESKDGIKFNTIGSLNAVNNFVNQYSFNGTTNLVGQAYYRLKMIDNDGRFQYSNVVFLKNSIKSTSIVSNTIVQDRNVTLQIADLPIGNYQFELLNANGQIMQKASIAHAGIDLRKTIALKNNVSTGSYFIKLIGNGFNETAQIIIQ